MSLKNTGWLIEHRPSPGARPAWWALCMDGNLDWTQDDYAAIRYARQLDAQRVIQASGWGDSVTATQHAWL